MTFRFPRLAVLSLCTAGLLAASVVAQSPEAPPIKMGLWQTEVSMEMPNMPNMPGGHMGNHTTVTQSCITPETWKKDFANFQHGSHGADCKITNQQQGPRSLTVDETCSDSAYTTTVHFEASFDSDGQMHGHAKVHMAGTAFPNGMDMNMTMSSKFVSPACGDVQPDHPKMIQH